MYVQCEDFQPIGESEIKVILKMADLARFHHKKMGQVGH